MAHENLQEIIAGNIAELRRSKGLTQAELAEKLGYSDKSVSKWERADGTPDIFCLKSMADLFGVSVDYMLSAEHPAQAGDAAPAKPADDGPRYAVSRRNITLVSVAGVWLLALLLSVTVKLSGAVFVLPLIAAIPVSALLLVIFNSLWGRREWQFFAVDFLVWGILLLICWLLRRHQPWLLMILGVPATAVVWFACGVKKEVRKDETED